MDNTNQQHTLYKLGNMQSDFYWFELLQKRAAVKGKKMMLGYVFIDSTDSFDADAMEKAYSELLRRNDAFRMRIIRKKGLPRQYFQELSLFPPPERRKIAGGNKELSAYFEKPDIPMMSVHDDRLTKAEIFTCDDGNGALVIWQHHICSDGYSMGKIVYPQICEFYDCYKNGSEPQEPKKIFSFADYLVSEQKINKQRWKKDFAWCWKEYHRNFFSYSIPLKFHPRWKNTALLSTEIKGEYYKNLENFCGEIHCSDASVLMSAAATVVKSETGAKRFMFNSESHGRSTYAQKHTVGAMLNELPIFFDFTEPATVSEFLANEYRHSVEVMMHMRFNGVVRESVLSLLPKMFRVGFLRSYRWMSFNNMKDYHEDKTSSLKFIMLDQQVDKGFTIQIMNLEEDDGIAVWLYYDPKIISKDAIIRYQRKFLQTLKFFREYPDKTVDDCLKYLN